MTALVTKHLPLVAVAPDGIKKLRALILELAVRGKLVAQDTSDATADSLLADIRVRLQEKSSSVRARKSLISAPIDVDELPFVLPTSWRWARFSEITSYVQRGKGPIYADRSQYPVISQKCVRWTGLDLSQARHIDPSSIERYEEVRHLVEGDILWNSTGTGTIGRACVVKSTMPGQVLVADSHVTVVRCESVVPEYLWRWIQTPTVQDQIEKSASGSTNQIELNTSTVLAHLAPIPPLAEQHRIVAKVDELMALCDRLEADQADAEAAHAQLVQALLGSLNQATNAADFRASWQRLSEHFHTLFTTEASIDALKQTVLRLGFMGKLVPHLDDVHASRGMLEAIATAKAQLPDAGRLRQADDSTPATRADVPFEFPAAWQVARMADLCEPVTSGSTPPSSEMKESEGIPFLKVYNIREQRIDFDYKRQFVDEAYHLAKMKRSALKPNDVVMNIVGPPLGKTAIIPDSYANWNCNQAIVFFRPIAPMNPRFIYLFLCEGSFLEGIELIGTAGQDNISVTKSRNIVVPIPTNEEQHRIVAKVDELMALCDQIKVHLAEAHQQHGQLAKVLIDHALGINANLSKPHSDRPDSNAPILNFDQERSPRLMTEPPATVEQLVACINELGDLATPERLLKHTGLSEDVEAFYDLLRAARDSGAVVVPLGSDTAIRRARNAD